MTNKVCNKCNATKAFIDFHKQADCVDGYRSTCKGCIKDRKQSHYIKNKDLYADRFRKWSYCNDRSSYFAKYREENKEKIKQYFISTRHISSKNTAIRRSRILKELRYGYQK